MSMIVDDPALDAALQSWVERIGGGVIVTAQRVSGGAFRASCRLGIKAPDGARCLFVKVDLGSAPKTPFNLEREYRVLAALDGKGRAPRAIGFDAALGALAMECLDGSADYRDVAEAHRAIVEQSFVEALVGVHRVDLVRLGLAHLPAGLTVAEAIAAELDLWETVLTAGVSQAHPIATFALAWARARLPQDDRPAVLVQGDAGPGNFLYDDAGVTGLVDWEMAHLGHPLEDLGCVLARSLVQSMAPAERLLALYGLASGCAWRREELLYATVLVMARFCVPIELSLAARDPRMDYGLTNSYYHLAQIALLALIAEAEGVALDEGATATGGTQDVTFDFDYLRHVLANIVAPTITDPFVRYRLDGAIGMVGYLANAVGGTAPESEPAVAEALVDAAHLVDAGGPALARRMQTLMSEALHVERLMQPMLGPLYGRRITI